MIGAVLALLAAVASGISIIIVRRNSDRSSSFSTGLIITAVGAVVLWFLAFAFVWQEQVTIVGVMLFGLSGFLSPGLVRLFYYRGLNELGASTNSAVFSIYPLYSALLAVVILGEALTGQNWAGIVCIACGVVFLQYCNREEGCEERRSLKKWFFPVTAGIGIAIGSIISKYALTVSDAPFFGVAVAYTFSLVPFVVILLVSSHVRASMNLKRDLRFFWLAGVGQAICWVFTYAAFHFDQVALANPLISTEPVFIVLFGYFLLRDIEHVSKKLAAAILLTVIGVALVAL